MDYCGSSNMVNNINGITLKLFKFYQYQKMNFCRKHSYPGSVSIADHSDVACALSHNSENMVYLQDEGSNDNEDIISTKASNAP
jgi:hypothetical protein